MARWFSLLAAIACAFAVSMPAIAASPHAVDPSTVSPPLNPGFAPWTCTSTGGGPVCRGHEAFTWEGADLGLACDGRPLYTTGSADIDATRRSDPQGRATDTAFHNEVVERWSFAADGSGPSLVVRARFNEAFTYGVAGDTSTRTYRLTGGYYQVTVPGIGVVWHDVGRLVTGAGADAPTVFHGPHDSDYGVLEEILPAVCAALGG